MGEMRKHKKKEKHTELWGETTLAQRNGVGGREEEWGRERKWGGRVRLGREKGERTFSSRRGGWGWKGETRPQPRTVRKVTAVTRAADTETQL